MHKSIVLALIAIASTARAVSAENVSDAPAGLRATKVTLAQVFAAYHRAESGTRANTRSESWTISFGGVGGTRTEVVNADGFRIDETRGPYHTAYGEYRGRAWHMNDNGQTVVEQGIHQRDAISADAVRSATAGSKHVRVIGQVDAPVHAYVVQVDPPGGRLKYVFFDTQTGLLDRIEQVREGRRETISYDDYRVTNGYHRAWHVAFEDGLPNNLRDEKLLSLTVNQPVSDSAVAIPADLRRLISIPNASPMPLPAKILNDRIILTFHIGTHTVNFQLDSGASGIVIDRDVVRALKLPETGRVTGETAGEYVESSVIVPRMTTGDLVLENVSARSLPFADMADESTPVAGLMGFDFLESVVAHIDYQHGTLELISPDRFVAPAGAEALPIALDDDVPQISPTIGTTGKLHFMLDTGADRSVLFTAFAQAHPHEIADEGLGTAMRASFPFVRDLSGVGGDVSYQPVQVAQLRIGAWTFPRWLFYLTQNAPSFESEDYDGLIGQDVLRNYDVYLDYAHQRVYLKPNDRYRARWGG